MMPKGLLSGRTIATEDVQRARGMDVSWLDAKASIASVLPDEPTATIIHYADAGGGSM